MASVHGTATLFLAAVAASALLVAVEAAGPAFAREEAAFAALASQRMVAPAAANGSYVQTGKAEYIAPGCAALYELLTMTLTAAAETPSKTTVYLACAAGSAKDINKMDVSWGTPDWVCADAAGSYTVAFSPKNKAKLSLLPDKATCSPKGGPAVMPRLGWGAGSPAENAAKPVLLLGTNTPALVDTMSLTMQGIEIDGGGLRPGLSLANLKTASIKDVSVFNTYASGVGSGVNVFDSKVTWSCKEACYIQNCTAVPYQESTFQGAGSGLAVSFTYSSPAFKMSGVTFRNNYHAIAGGAFSIIKYNIKKAAVSFSSCVFEGNSAPSCGTGVTLRDDGTSTTPGEPLTVSTKSCTVTGSVGTFTLCGLYSKLANDGATTMAWDYAVSKGSWTIYKPDAFGAVPTYPPIANPTAKPKDQVRGNISFSDTAWVDYYTL